MDTTFMEKDAWKFFYKLMIKEDQLAVECRKSSRLEEALDSARAQLSSANAKIAGILRPFVLSLIRPKCVLSLIRPKCAPDISRLFYLFEELNQQVKALKMFIEHSMRQQDTDYPASHSHESRRD